MRVGDLVLHDVRAAVPARIDDHLRVAQIRQRVERHRAHGPQPSHRWPRAIRKRTTALLRAENSMMASIITSCPRRPCRSVSFGAAFRDGRFHLAFGIDQEVARSHHPLARLEPREYLDAVAIALAGAHLRSARSSRCRGRRRPLFVRRRRAPLRPGPSASTEPPPGTRPRRTCRASTPGRDCPCPGAPCKWETRIHLRLDVFDPPRKDLAGQGLERYSSPVAQTDIRDFVLENVRGTITWLVSTMV